MTTSKASSMGDALQHTDPYRPRPELIATVTYVLGNRAHETEIRLSTFVSRMRLGSTKQTIRSYYHSALFVVRKKKMVGILSADHNAF